MRNGTTWAIAALLASAAPAAAQTGAYVEPYVGYYAFDESSFEDAYDGLALDESPIVGVRLGWGRGTWQIEGAYGRAGFDGEGATGDVVEPFDTTIHLFYVATNWTLPLGPVRPFVSGGLGAATYAPEVGDGATDVVVSFGAGLRVSVGDRLGVRVDAKDHVDLCGAPEAADEVGACFDDETLQNIELSGGLEIRL